MHLKMLLRLLCPLLLIADRVVLLAYLVQPEFVDVYHYQRKKYWTHFYFDDALMSSLRQPQLTHQAVTHWRYLSQLNQ